MAHTVCVQDWITISGDAGQRITQAESDWIQVPSFQDVVAYCEISSLSSGGGATLDLQTSPTKDESFFGAAISGGSPYLVSFPLSITSFTSGVQNLQVVHWASATNQPLARFVRWRLICASTAPTTVTFRLYLSLNQAGWR